MEQRYLGQTVMNVSALSFGASSLGGVFRATDDTESARTVHTALDLGINFIDVSPYYGATRAETVLGKALQGIARSRFYLATKVGQYGEGLFDFSAQRIKKSLDESCSRLGVDYIDLLQCHDIEFTSLDQIVDESLPALHELKKEGRIGHVGITGLPLKIFPEVIDRVPPGIVQTILSFCHYDLNDTSLETLLPYFSERCVGVINAAPTGMGLLTPRGVPSWHPATPAMIATARKAVEYCAARGSNIVKLAIQFSISNPAIATTLVSSANPDNIRRNIEYANEPFDAELLSEVQKILAPIKNHNFMRGRPENCDSLIP